MTFLSGTSACSWERLQIHIVFQELLQRRSTIQCKKQILNNYSTSCVQNVMAKNQNLPVGKVIFFMIYLQLAPTKTTERLFMFVESMLISHSSNKDGKVAQPGCALFKGRSLVFSQSYRMMSIWLCPYLFWKDKCHFSNLKWCLNFFPL